MVTTMYGNPAEDPFEDSFRERYARTAEKLKAAILLLRDSVIDGHPGVCECDRPKCTKRAELVRSVNHI
jgi:hypothetical protein